MIWVGTALAALALVRGVRWWARRTDALGRSRAFPAITVGLSAALAVGAFGQALLHLRTERRLSAAASVVAGLPVRVHCQSLAKASVDLGPELGYVRFTPNGRPEREALIKWETCRRLSAWLRSDKSHPTSDQVIAVHVLTHEAMHMAGTADEAVAECQAVQHDVALAEALGASAADARRLALDYWRDVYPRMPDTYRSGECRPGGTLDQRRPDAPWA
jgi:hypothetical protein